MSVQKKAEGIEAGNARSYTELCEKMQELGVPGFNMDTGDARLAIFIDHLQEWGIITEDQRWEFELAFHTKVEDSLNEVWEKVREREAELKKPRIATPPPKSGLVDGHGRPLT